MKALKTIKIRNVTNAHMLERHHAKFFMLSIYNHDFATVPMVLVFNVKERQTTLIL